MADFDKSEFIRSCCLLKTFSDIAQRIIGNGRRSDGGELVNGCYAMPCSNLARIDFVIIEILTFQRAGFITCLLYTSPSPRDLSTSRMPSSA